MEIKFLTQHVTDPTNTSGNVLNLVLSLAENLVKEVQMEGRLEGSDHKILICAVGVPVERKDGKTMARNYRKADFEEMRRRMVTNWQEALKGKSLNDVDNHQGKNYWWNRQAGATEGKKNTQRPKMVIKRNKKKKMWGGFKKSGSEIDRRQYKEVEKEVKRTIWNKKNGI
jgi:hypothetical protein